MHRESKYQYLYIHFYDSVTRIMSFINLWPYTGMTICQVAIKNCLSRFKILPNTTNCPKLYLKFNVRLTVDMAQWSIPIPKICRSIPGFGNLHL